MIEGEIGGLTMGDSSPVRLIGVVNLSKESFYKGSIATSLDKIVGRSQELVSQGADVVDLGGMSTAPYKETWVTEEVETSRLQPAISELSRVIKVPISVDTYRPAVAEMALRAGAMIINDVSGLGIYPSLARVISGHDASVIACARLSAPPTDDNMNPIWLLSGSLRHTLSILREERVNPKKIAIDPCIGFPILNRLDEPYTSTSVFRQGNPAWPFWRWDSYVVANLHELRKLDLPIVVGVSRKSFIRKICDLDDPEKAVFGSVAAEAIAVTRGAHAIRTHNPLESKQAVRIAEEVMKQADVRPRAG